MPGLSFNFEDAPGLVITPAPLDDVAGVENAHLIFYHQVVQEALLLFDSLQLLLSFDKY